MLAAVATMTAMGLSLGALLGLAARRLKVEGDPIADEIEAIMPGTNCGQCGFPGCRAAAEAVAAAAAPVTLCPPGGRMLASELAELLGVEADLSEMGETTPMVAFIFEDQCTGCTKCFKRCPTDAIIGASRQIHTVINDACTGCDACAAACPTQAIVIRPRPDTLQNWHWPKPADGLDAAAAPAREVAA
ncbi:MAG: electron transport complex subunit RsxB [Pseudomonadota bacterium]